MISDCNRLTGRNVLQLDILKGNSLLKADVTNHHKTKDASQLVEKQSPKKPQTYCGGV